MLISDSHEFVFLRMRKAASTSMSALLEPYALPRPAGNLAHLKSRARLEWDYRRYFFNKHADILTVKRRMPAETFERYFKFAFVRNPWDRLVSEYEFLLRKPDHGRHARVRKLGGFKPFIRMQIPRRDAYQINMLCNRRGKFLMDFVGKTENLQNDWKTVCERIGVEHQALPVINATQHRHYQEYYDDESRQLVARHWRREIELFEYTFDD